MVFASVNRGVLQLVCQYLHAVARTSSDIDARLCRPLHALKSGGNSRNRPEPEQRLQQQRSRRAQQRHMPPPPQLQRELRRNAVRQMCALCPGTVGLVTVLFCSVRLSTKDFVDGSAHDRAEEPYWVVHGQAGLQ